MSSTHLERAYKCWNDCQMAGCPGHTATLDMQSVSESFVFEDGRGQMICIQQPEMQTLLSMVFELEPTQVFIESMIRDARADQNNKQGVE